SSSLFLGSFRRRDAQLLDEAETAKRRLAALPDVRHQQPRELRSLRLAGPQAGESRGAPLWRAGLSLQEPPHDLQRRAGHREGSRRLGHTARTERASTSRAEAKPRPLQRSTIPDALAKLRLITE